MMVAGGRVMKAILPLELVCLMMSMFLMQMDLSRMYKEQRHLLRLGRAQLLKGVLPVAPHDGSATATWSADYEAGTITLNGTWVLI